MLVSTLVIALRHLRATGRGLYLDTFFSTINGNGIVWNKNIVICLPKMDSRVITSYGIDFIVNKNHTFLEGGFGLPL